MQPTPYPPPAGNEPERILYSCAGGGFIFLRVLAATHTPGRKKQVVDRGEVGLLICAAGTPEDPGAGKCVPALQEEAQQASSLVGRASTDALRALRGYMAD